MADISKAILITGCSTGIGCAILERGGGAGLAASLAFGVLDAATLLRRLLVHGLLHALRPIDRARQRVEHGFAALRRALGGGLAAAAAANYERHRDEHARLAGHRHEPSPQGDLPAIYHSGLGKTET